MVRILKYRPFSHIAKKYFLRHIFCIIPVFYSGISQLKNHIVMVQNDRLNPGFVMVFSLQNPPSLLSLLGIPWKLKKSHKGEKILEDEVSKDLFTGLLFLW